ncbi:hypothetical protein VTL71DRAFT_1909 [Oculimacula yallundae]|uniref:Uncharacterized protein n=1 Tax=Oculimacula yallundae TaxID=86028 RepID=A0ABR4CC56_9HELO
MTDLLALTLQYHIVARQYKKTASREYKIVQERRTTAKEKFIGREGPKDSLNRNDSTTSVAGITGDKFYTPNKKMEEDPVDEQGEVEDQNVADTKEANTNRGNDNTFVDRDFINNVNEED